MKVKLDCISLRELLAVTLLGSTAFFAPAHAADSVTVAYFLGGPAPLFVAKADGTFNKALGTDVQWRDFGNGNEMNAAMVSGDVQIAYSQGLVPFVLGTSKGVPIKIIAVAASNSAQDNCVVAKGAGITQANAKDLEGKKIATPIGNVTHYKLLRMLQHFNVDVTKVELLQMNPPDGAAALQRGDVTMACGFGAGYERMKEFGSDLMTAEEQEAIGLRVFDVVSATEDFIKNNPDQVTAFLQVVEDANTEWNKDPTANIDVVAKEAGITREVALPQIPLNIYMPRDQQLSKDWLGGGVQSFMNEVADFYVEQKLLPKRLLDYSITVDTSFLEKVK